MSLVLDRAPARYGLIVNEAEFEPAAPHPVVSVASTAPVEAV